MTEVTINPDNIPVSVLANGIQSYHCTSSYFAEEFSLQHQKKKQHAMVLRPGITYFTITL